MSQHLSGGGKYVRAGLVLLSAAAAGAEERAGLVGAVAIELVHNFSLVHDDIIDGDLERRHRPTVWAEYGVGHAIIAGDALSTLAFQILLEEPTAERVRAAARLAEATQAMIAGQAEDMASEHRASLSVEECLQMEAGKTGALLSCAAAIGAILAGAPTTRRSTRWRTSAGISGSPSRRSTTCSGSGASRASPASRSATTFASTRRPCRSRSRSPGATTLPPSSCRLLERELTDAEVAEATRLLEECGAREETMAIGEAHLRAALARSTGSRWRSAASSELAAIARYVTERDR